MEQPPIIVAHNGYASSGLIMNSKTRTITAGIRSRVLIDADGLVTRLDGIIDLFMIVNAIGHCKFRNYDKLHIH